MGNFIQVDNYWIIELGCMVFGTGCYGIWVMNLLPRGRDADFVTDKYQRTRNTAHTAASG